MHGTLLAILVLGCTLTMTGMGTGAWLPASSRHRQPTAETGRAERLAVFLAAHGTA